MRFAARFEPGLAPPAVANPPTQWLFSIYQKVRAARNAEIGLRRNLCRERFGRAPQERRDDQRGKRDVEGSGKHADRAHRPYYGELDIGKVRHADQLSGT